MSHSSASFSKSKWHKIGWTFLLVLLIAYHFGRPALEQATGWSLPTLTGPSTTEPEENTNESTPKSKHDSESGDSSSNDIDERYPASSVGRKEWTSPYGLTYRMGPRGEHRIEHVMRHTVDDPTKEAHGVFDDGDQRAVLRLIDEAYNKAWAGGPGITKKAGNVAGRTEYVVDMGRRIGYLGGQRGTRKSNPACQRIKLVLADTHVITAFPY